MMDCSRSFYQWIRILDDAEVRDVCLCSRCFGSSIWICQSVQSLVMLSSVMYIYGPLGSRSLALWGSLRDRVNNQLSSLDSTVSLSDNEFKRRIIPRDSALYLDPSWFLKSVNHYNHC
jgi:hypothetical protein